MANYKELSKIKYVIELVLENIERIGSRTPANEDEAISQYECGVDAHHVLDMLKADYEALWTAESRMPDYEDLVACEERRIHAGRIGDSEISEAICIY